MSEDYSPFPHDAPLTPWTGLAWRNSEHGPAVMGDSDPPKLDVLKTELDSHGSKTAQTEWDAYFN